MFISMRSCDDYPKLSIISLHWKWLGTCLRIMASHEASSPGVAAIRADRDMNSCNPIHLTSTRARITVLQLWCQYSTICLVCRPCHPIGSTAACGTGHGFQGRPPCSVQEHIIQEYHERGGCSSGIRASYGVAKWVDGSIKSFC